MVDSELTGGFLTHYLLDALRIKLGLQGGYNRIKIGNKPCLLWLGELREQGFAQRPRERHGDVRGMAFARSRAFGRVGSFAGER